MIKVVVTYAEDVFYHNNSEISTSKLRIIKKNRMGYITDYGNGVPIMPSNEEPFLLLFEEDGKFLEAINKKLIISIQPYYEPISSGQ